MRGAGHQAVSWSLIGTQAVAATARRPGKSLLTALGVALGIAVFLVTVGWSQTIGADVNRTFDELAATQLRIRDTSVDAVGIGKGPAMSDDFERRIELIPGVVAGGRVWNAGTYDARRSVAAEPVTLTALAVDPGFFEAADTTLGSGRLPDQSTVALETPTAVLGPEAARQLGLVATWPGLAIELGETRVQVMGILESVGRAPELASAVIVSATAPIAEGNLAPERFDMGALVQVQLGTAGQVASQLPIALRPDDPGRLGVLLPPEPESLRASVQSSLDTLAYGAAVLSLVIGAIGIMNSMLVAVTHRAGEIGLRRALGAGRRHVAAQFLAEGAVLGLVGTVVGVLVGEAGLIVLAQANDLAPVLDRALLAFAPAVGVTIGLLSSLYPSLRAARMRPADTLRA